MKNEDASSSGGLPSPTPEHEGFLILRCPRALTEEMVARIKGVAEPLAQEIGLKCLVFDDGMDATVIPAGIGELVQEMRTQSAAINRLAASNEGLIQAMIESEGMDEDLPLRTYLNGKPTL